MFDYRTLYEIQLQVSVDFLRVVQLIITDKGNDQILTRKRFGRPQVPKSSAMEFRERFRHLVSNKYMTDFEYHNCKFSFMTVFYKSAYLYCCCPCAFDHEYMNYLRNDGSINYDIFDRVVNTIVEGKCQHVDKVPEKFINETYINALHIASAVATEKVIKMYSDVQQMYSATGIFRLHPCALAVMKNYSRCFETFFKGSQFCTHVNKKCPFLYATKSDKDPSKVILQNVYLLELAVMKNNVQLISNILSSPRIIPSGMSQALQYAINNELLDVLPVLAEYIQFLATDGKIANVLFCSEVAIVLDRPAILEQCLKDKHIKQGHGTLKHWLWDTCCILRRQECKDVLSKYDTIAVEEKSVIETEKHMTLLEMFYYDSCKKEVIAALKESYDSSQGHLSESKNNSQEGQEVLCSWPSLQNYLNPNKRLIDTRIVSTMFDLGIDVNSVDEYGKSTLIHFLENDSGYFMTYKNFMAVLKTLIYENPAAKENKTATELALKIDTKSHVSWWCSKFEYNMEGNYEMDHNVHSVFDGGSVEAVNFVCPFLLDCGFEAKMNLLQNAIDEGNLHEAELEYFQKYLDEFRPLMLRCRDVLRQHFMGRKLHTFLETQSMPNKIKDFILINT